MVIGSSNSDLRPPASPSSPSVGIRCLADQRGPQRCADLSCSTRMGTGTPQGLQERGTHLCGESARARVAPLGSPGPFIGRRCPKNKSAPLQSLLGPGRPLGAGGLVLIRIISLIWVTAARTQSGSVRRQLLSSSLSFPQAKLEPAVSLGSVAHPGGRGGWKQPAASRHDAGTRRGCGRRQRGSPCHHQAPPTQQNQGLGAGGKRCPLLGFPAGSWVAN